LRAFLLGVLMEVLMECEIGFPSHNILVLQSSISKHHYSSANPPTSNGISSSVECNQHRRLHVCDKFNK